MVLRFSKTLLNDFLLVGLVEDLKEGGLTSVSDCNALKLEKSYV